MENTQWGCCDQGSLFHAYENLIEWFAITPIRTKQPESAVITQNPQEDAPPLVCQDWQELSPQDRHVCHCSPLFQCKSTLLTGGLRHTHRVFPDFAQRGERTTVSVTFALFVCGNLICANATVQRQKLCSLRFADECPGLPFQVLTPIGGLTGLCTALTPCHTAGARARYTRLCREWEEFHAIPPTRPRPRMRFQSRHSRGGACNAYEPSIATVLIPSEVHTRSFDIPSDLLFLPTEPPEVSPDTTFSFQPQFVSSISFCCKAFVHQ